MPNPKQATPELDAAYVSWLSMKNRCSPKAKGKAKKYYFDRGVTVCERWKANFQAFIEDMGPRPNGTSIDRFPNGKGNYEPGNCRWATDSEQVSNRDMGNIPARSPIEWNGRSQALRRWEMELGCRPGCLESRMARGWSIEKTMTTPFTRR